MMKDLGKKHTFVICAYKESPFLEECILSRRLFNSSEPSIEIEQLNFFVQQILPDFFGSQGEGL